MDQPIHINYKDDFIIREEFRDAAGNIVPIPDGVDFVLTYTVKHGHSFTASRSGNTYENCLPDGNAILVIFKNHGLCEGILRRELHLKLPNDLMPDGIQNTFSPVNTSVILWNLPSDHNKVIHSNLVAAYVQGPPLTFNDLTPQQINALKSPTPTKLCMRGITFNSLPGNVYRWDGKIRLRGTDLGKISIDTKKYRIDGVPLPLLLKQGALKCSINMGGSVRGSINHGADMAVDESGRLYFPRVHNRFKDGGHFIEGFNLPANFVMWEKEPDGALNLRPVHINMSNGLPTPRLSDIYGSYVKYNGRTAMQINPYNPSFASLQVQYWGSSLRRFFSKDGIGSFPAGHRVKRWRNAKSDFNNIITCHKRRNYTPGEVGPIFGTPFNVRVKCRARFVSGKRISPWLEFMAVFSRVSPKLAPCRELAIYKRVK